MSAASPASVTAVAAAETTATLHTKCSSDSSAKEEDGSTVMATNVDNPRTCILRVGAEVGRICAIGNKMIIAQECNMSIESELVSAMEDLFAGLFLTSKSLRLNWVRSIRTKMLLNERKYPVELCKVGIISLLGVFCSFCPSLKELSFSA